MSSPGIPDGLLDDGNTRYCVPTGDKNSQQKKKHDAMTLELPTKPEQHPLTEKADSAQQIWKKHTHPKSNITE